jgi:hypothetical protein
MTDPVVDPVASTEEDDDLGFFPSWNSLYWSVVVYTAASILVLYWITVALDYRIS